MSPLIHPPQPIFPDGFTNSQKKYLRGLMSDPAWQDLLPFVGETADGRLTHEPQPGMSNLATPVEETVHGVPLSKLCREERWKYEENPLDAWDRILAHAEKDQLPEAENTFRFKTFGLFHVSPVQKSFMLRCRIPAGILTSVQMHGLAEIADDWGGGYADITTRANIQIREIAPQNVVNVLGKLQDLGLTSRGSGADNVRNITASPVSGVDPIEIYDCRPLAKALHHYILNHRDLYGLPRKFNVAFDGGGSISVVADTNDIGFVAVRVPEGHAIEPGVYFRAILAGITGHEQFASDAGLLLKPVQCVAVAAAMIRVFSEHGDRTNRKKARLKYLIDRWGIPKFIQETGAKLAFPLVHFPSEKCEVRRPPVRHGHIGIYRQPQRGLNYIGVVIPVGRMKTRQMHRLADIAQNYGNGELRLTVFQNLVLPNIPDAFVDAVKRSLVWMGFHHESTSISGGLVACTGNTGCRYSSTNTKGQAVELARALEKKVRLDQPINIHLTGCPHSCAQHYIGDIGLLGAKTSEGGQSVEAYTVVLGGGFDHAQGIAREVFRKIPFTQIPSLLERILVVYQQRRKSGETLAEFTRRHEVKELQEMFSE
jgi:ferredoxin-nitrite reductase